MDKNPERTRKIKPELLGMNEQIKLSKETIQEIESHLLKSTNFLREEIVYLEFHQDYLQHMENSNTYSEEQKQDLREVIKEAKLVLETTHHYINTISLYKTQFQVILDEFYDLEKTFTEILTTTNPDQLN